jgi:two-component system, NarL family, response regulator DegU
MEAIRVLLANHHPIVRSGLRSLLERDPKIRVVGEAANGREAILLAEYQNPEVAVLDIKLHSAHGLSAARTISSKQPRIKIIFVSPLTDEGYVHETFSAGARGYVFDESVQTGLLRAVFVVSAGGVFLTPRVIHTLNDERNRDSNSRGHSRRSYRRSCFVWLGRAGHKRKSLRL